MKLVILGGGGFRTPYVWQALIMLDVLLVWMIWIRRLPRASAHVPAGSAPGDPSVAAT